MEKGGNSHLSGPFITFSPHFVYGVNTASPLRRDTRSRGIHMKFTKASLVVSAAALSLGLAACDGPNENAMEDAGEQQAEAVNERVDAMEDAGTISDAQSDAITDQAEDKADAMEEQGEAMDDAQGM